MSHSLKTAGLAFALMAGVAFAGAALAEDQAPMGHMESDHMTSSPKPSDHMSSGAMASDHMATDHMATGAKHANKMKKPGNTPDAMSSDGMSNSQH